MLDVLKFIGVIAGLFFIAALIGALGPRRPNVDQNDERRPDE